MAVKQWLAKSFTPQICNLQALLLQHSHRPKNNEILAQKADDRWHCSDKACKLDICGLTLVAQLYPGADLLKKIQSRVATLL